MSVAVCIDSCAWDYFFKQKIDLAAELPRAEFDLFIVNETAIELRAIPDMGKDGRSNVPLKEYVADSLERAEVRVHAVFGFLTEEPDGSPSAIQVYGGFDEGIFAEELDNLRYKRVLEHYVLDRRRRPSAPLPQNQADAAVALRSFDAVVITNEKQTKSGPFKGARAEGGKIVYLSDWDPKALSLREFILGVKGKLPYVEEGI